MKNTTVFQFQKVEALWVKILLLGIIIASTSAHALVDCFYVDQFDENEIKKELVHYQSLCETAEGGGSKFYGSYSKVTRCIASNTAELVDSSFGVWQNGEGGGSLGAFPKVCSKVDSSATGCKEVPESSSSVQSSSSSAAEFSSSESDKFLISDDKKFPCQNELPKFRQKGSPPQLQFPIPNP